MRWTNLILLVFMLLGATACQGRQRRPSRYLIPEGYMGWVRVDFKVKDAPATPFEDGYYLFKFPLSGKIETSSDIEYGVAKDEYYYYSDTTRRLLKVTGWGGGGMIWTGFNGSAQGNNEPPYEYFFVGTEDEENRYADKVDRDDANHPKVGPIDPKALR
jgi:hypothetical protein